MSNNYLEEDGVDGGDSIRLLSANWRKSSFSMSNGDCVEVAFLGDDYIGVRDSKATVEQCLRFRTDTWMTFIGEIRIIHSRNEDLFP